MDGLLIIDKPEGWTSHDVVAKARRILGTRSIGHTGTLDPFATGVLVLVVGKATRLAQFLDKDEKEYEAVVGFGYETETGDRTGTPTTPAANVKVAIAQIENALAEFRGEVRQVPPMYSAKKHAGRKLYELARKGETVERRPVNVTISILDALVPDDATEVDTVRLRVVCSAGTYIRTLAGDIGRRLGVGAHLRELRRIRAGRFDLGQCLSINDIESAEDVSSLLLPVEYAVARLPKYMLADDRVEKTRKGLSTRTEPGQYEAGQPIRMVDSSGKLVAIGYLEEDNTSVHPRIVLE